MIQKCSACGCDAILKQDDILLCLECFLLSNKYDDSLEIMVDDSGAPHIGWCVFCDTIQKGDSYCFGCKSFVCDSCNIVVDGHDEPHKPIDHVMEVIF